MAHGFLNLNEPAVEDGIVRYAMLQKDNKPICRARCFILPFEVPAIWAIREFRQSKIYWQLNLPQCQLYPEPENYHQKKEWGSFMSFLWENKKVAVVRTLYCNFYILAPDGCREFTHAIVLYYLYKPCPTLDVGEVGTPGDAFICHQDVEYPVQGDLCRSLSRITADTFPHEVVEEASSRPPPSAPIRDVYRKNFVRTDPSYLRTLSQTHAGWTFGAIAELVDNARDADATRLDISIECLYSKRAAKRIPVLSIIDDGQGMSHVDIVRMLSFGHKKPNRDDPFRIGRFGIGFKTGAMKLGRDALVLTQTSSSRSVAFLSQSFNENKENLEIPIITYCKQGSFMEVDLSIQSDASAAYHLKAIKEFSPFNEYFIGEKLGLFGELRTGTQIYIWNLDEWGSGYSLEWSTGETTESAFQQSQGDILIRSRRVRSRPGQISQQVPLDYSLQAYLEVIFLDPRMKIYVQGSLVRSRPLAKSLNKTLVVKGHLMGKALELILGRSQEEWDRMNGGIFLYWHGRLIEAYKRVGGMIHNADMGRGVLGVVDVTNMMDDGNGHVWVLNNKQGFQDCEVYAKLEEWLSKKLDEYWDENFDTLDLKKGNASYKRDHEWVQCNKCRKWRILSPGFHSESLPMEWFCYMPPFNGKCETPEKQVGRGVITIAAKRSGYESGEIVVQHDETKQNMKCTSENKNHRAKRLGCNNDQKHLLLDDTAQKSTNSPALKYERAKQSEGGTRRKFEEIYEVDSEEDSTETAGDASKPVMKRLRRGPPRNCKKL